LTELLQWLVQEDKKDINNILDYSQAIFDQLSNIASSLKAE
jgi:hypothetical protein